MNQENKHSATGFQTQVSDGGTAYIDANRSTDSKQLAENSLVGGMLSAQGNNIKQTLDNSQNISITFVTYIKEYAHNSKAPLNEESEDKKKWERYKLVILQQIKNKPELINFIKKAYWEIIINKTIWSDFRQESTEINEILKQVEEIPNSDSRSKFIYNLLQDKNLPEEVRILLQSVGNVNSNQNSNKDVSEKELHSYLLIQLRPEGTGKLFVRAWFIPDDTIPDYEERFKPLKVDEQATEILFEQEKWSQLLSNLIQQCLGKYLQGQPTKLTIEVFLPRERLWDEIEKWEYLEESESGKYYSTPIGTKYGVVVRCYYRLRTLGKPKYKYKETDWRNNWQKIKEICEEKIPCNEEVIATVPESDFCPNELREWLIEQIILKVSCYLEDTQKNALLDAIDIRATPIVLLSRKKVQSLKNSNDFDKLLEDKPLNGLSERVRKLRYAAKKAKDEKHLGNHLILLWDDPNRLPKDPLLESLA